MSGVPSRNGVGFVAVLVLVLVPACRAPRKDWIDAEGVDRFWDVHTTLVQDEEPDEEMWDALFSAPGYRQLDRVEGRSKWMKPIFAMAYRPSLAGELAERKATGDFVGSMLLPHLEMVGENREAIDGFVAEFTGDRTLDVALREVRRYLPEGAGPRDDVPPVFLVIIDGDGKALSDSIVIDAFALSSWDEPVMVLAHELHHVFRGPLARVTKKDVAPEEADLFKVIEQLEEEGVAEMIDKPKWIESGIPELSPHPLLAWVQERYRTVKTDAPDAIRELDRGLIAVGRDPTTVEREGERLAERITSPDRHTVGLFMAHAIERELGRERLVSTVGNPFAFARLYTEAANRSPERTPPLSDEALEVIRDWEARSVDGS